MRLPLVGFMPYLERQFPHKCLWRLSSTYGTVVGLYFGTQPTVVVNGWEAVKESLLNDDLNGRPETVVLNLVYNNTQRGKLNVSNLIFRFAISCSNLMLIRTS